MKMPLDASPSVVMSTEAMPTYLASDCHDMPSVYRMGAIMQVGVRGWPGWDGTRHLQSQQEIGHSSKRDTAVAQNHHRLRLTLAREGEWAIGTSCGRPCMLRILR